MSVVLRKTPALGLNIIDFNQVGWHVPEHENMYILDAMINQFVKFTVTRGVWVNSTDYLANDTVIDTTDSSIWKCLVAHTSAPSGLFQDDRATRPGLWVLVIGGATSEVQVPFVTPEQFQAAGDGFTDDTTAWVNMLAFAIANKMRIQADKRYKITSSIVQQLTDNLTVDGHGTILPVGIADSQPALWFWVNPVPATQAILGFSVDTFDYSNSNPSSLPTTVSKLQLNPGHGIQPRSLVKVISNDVIAQSSPDARYQGEVAFVGAVSGNFVYLTGLLRNIYVTSPRLIVYDTSKRFSWRGVSFEGQYGASPKYSMMAVEGMVFPRVRDVVFKNTSIAGLVPMSCVFLQGSNLSFENGQNAVGANTPGYGIQDSCSEYSIYTGINGVNMRHVYTTIALTTDVTDEYTYGEPVGHVINGGQSVGASAAAFDTHSASRGITFIGCNDTMSYIGEDSPRSGINLRGSRHFVANCNHIGSGNGVTVYKQYAGEETNHYISGYHYTGEGRAIYIKPAVGTVTVDFENIFIYGSADGAIWLKNAAVRIRNLTLRHQGGSNTSPIYMDGGVTLDVWGKNNLFDLTPGSGSGRSIIKYEGTNVTNLEGLVRASAAWDSIARGLTAPSGGAFGFDIDCSLMPIQPVSNATGASLYIQLKQDGGATSNYANQAQTLAAGGNTVSINNSSEPVMVKQCANTQATAQITVLGAGRIIGQILVITNNHDSTQAFQVINNHTNLIDCAANVTVNPGSGMAFLWNGLVWKSFSQPVTASGGGGVTDHGALTGLLDDDHPQYHNDARAAIWLATQNLAVLADVPALGTAGQVLQVNTGATALEYGTKLTAKLTALDSLLDVLFFFATATGEPRFRVKNSTSVVKSCLTHWGGVIGGDDTERVGTETLTVVGDLNLKGGGIISDKVASDFSNPALIGVIRLWDDGTGKLRAKSGSDPTSATDGTALY